MRANVYFEVITPLNVRVRTTFEYWQYLITKKHKTMEGKEEIVKEVLNHPDEIRQSKIDKTVFLYYKRFDKLYCVVAKHRVEGGFW